MTVSTPTSPRSPTLIVMPIVLFNLIIYFLIGLPNAIIGALFVHEALGFSTAIAGMVLTTQYLGTFVGRLFAGGLVDKYGPKRILMIGIAACMTSGLLMAAASLWAASAGFNACHFDNVLRYSILGVALLSRLFMGWAESWTATPVTTWNIHRVGREHISVAISWNGVTTYAGIGFGVGAGQWLSRLPEHATLPIGQWLTGLFHNPQTIPEIGLFPVGMTSFCLALGALILLSFYKALPPLNSPKKTTMPLIKAIGKVLPYGTGLAAGSFGFGSINAFLALYYDANQWTNVGSAFVVFSACFIATRLLGTKPIDRGYAIKIAMVSLAMESVAFATLALAHSPAWTLLGVALTATGFSLVFPALGTEAVKTDAPEYSGTLNAAFSLFTDSTIFFVGPLMGFVKDCAGWTVMFWTVSALCAGGIASTLGLLALRKKSAK